MKKVLSILFLLFGIFSFAQVPNTTTFNLQNVTGYVVPTTNDLVDCFSDAKLGAFDMTHKASYLATYGTNNLLMFRNYNLANCGKSGTYGPIYSTTGSGTISYPLNVAAHTIVVAHFMIAGSETVTLPSGWSTLVTVTNSGGTYRTVVAYRLYTAATSGTLVFSFSGTANKCAVLHERYNCSTITYKSAVISTNATGTSCTTYGGGAGSGICCSTYIASVIIASNQTITPSVGTGWTSIGGLSTANNGGWAGWGAAYFHTTSCSTFTLPSCSFSWPTGANWCHVTLEIY